MPLYRNIAKEASWLVRPSKPFHFALAKVIARARPEMMLRPLCICDENIFRLKPNTSTPLLFVDGYFQYGWTRDSFVLALERMNVIPAGINALSFSRPSEVAVHIRGGDFLGISGYRFLTEEYYLYALGQAMKSGFSNFVIVTDDLEYGRTMCEKLALTAPLASIRMADHFDDMSDFDILRSSSARIIGNSTFAWWASALATTAGPTWAPDHFVKHRQRDFFLPNELTISV